MERKWPGHAHLEGMEKRGHRLYVENEKWNRVESISSSWYQPPCGPHCPSEAHPAIEGWQSRPSGKPSVYLRILPWFKLQADHKLAWR